MLLKFCLKFVVVRKDLFFPVGVVFVFVLVCRLVAVLLLQFVEVVLDDLVEVVVSRFVEVVYW